MSDATTEPAVTHKADPEVRLTNDVAHALWLTAGGASLPQDPEGRKAAWKDAKKGQMQLTRALLKRLSKKGINVVRSDVTDAAANADADDADA